MSGEKPKDDDDPVEARRGIKEATLQERNERNKEKERYAPVEGTAVTGG